MSERLIKLNKVRHDEDWEGNTAVFTCPVCSKVFFVSSSGGLQYASRVCPNCERAQGWVKGAKHDGGEAGITWELWNDRRPFRTWFKDTWKLLKEVFWTSYFDFKPPAHDSDISFELRSRLVTKDSRLDEKAWIDESHFVEGLVNQRVQYLCVVSAFIVAGAFASQDVAVAIVILLIGSVVTRLLGVAVERAYAKTCFCLAVLNKKANTPVAAFKIVSDHCEGDTPPYFRSKEALGILGRGLPRLIPIFFFAGAAAVLMRYLLFSPTKREEQLTRPVFEKRAPLNIESFRNLKLDFRK